MKRLWHLPAVLSMLAALCMARPAHAQPLLIDASPAPDEVLLFSPGEVVLVFDQALSDQGSSLRVVDAEGRRVDSDNARIDPANRLEIRVGLPPLLEGTYTVIYTATRIGGSTFTAGSYTFTIDLPAPRLELKAPVDGASYAADQPVILEMDVQFFDFGLYNNRIRLYVDDRLKTELRALTYELNGLEPGVHEIRVVLTQFEDQELPDTAITVYVAVARHDPESEGRLQAAMAPPGGGLRFTLPGLAGLILGTLGLIGAGVGLARLDRVR